MNTHAHAAKLMQIVIFTVAKIPFTTDGENLYIWDIGLIVKTAIFTHH